MIPAAVAALATYPTRLRHRPLGPTGPTLSPDGTTGFATVGLRLEEVTTAMYDARAGHHAAAREAGVQVEYDSSLGYATGAAGAAAS